ncbi:hypothetical protein KSZ_76660 [Dictyobacter formicarum]|uniref:Uncharacterized protein n=1 Tax=Dictyobacter formicarum TaxID=2778368 RepID=A0ABQ3VUL2_9CHLR|nr:hypothetical protein KSZ_76660 [Dictyobacter formicarum]
MVIVLNAERISYGLAIIFYLTLVLMIILLPAWCVINVHLFMNGSWSISGNTRVPVWGDEISWHIPS